jgi:translation initiation factor RLI1
MSGSKYILTKYEKMLRVEKVEYTVEIPGHIKNKLAYAVKKIEDSDYVDYIIADIPHSKMLEEEIDSLRRA